MEKDKKVCLRERDIELLRFIGEYGVISNENVKLLYKSEYYYKNRLASLANGEMIERHNGKVVLGRNGRAYLNKYDWGCRNINRADGYKKRLERVSNIACKIGHAGWYFEPSWQCNTNKYTNTGNRFIGVMSRRPRGECEEDEWYFKDCYIIYFLSKDITRKELKVYEREMKRYQNNVKGFVIFVEDEEFLYCPRIVDINAPDVYTVLYHDRVWEYIKRIKDEDYSRDVVMDVFGDEYVKYLNIIFDMYYIKKVDSETGKDYYIYVVPILLPDFDKMDWVNYRATDWIEDDVKMKVICESEYVAYIREYLDELVEVVCLS